MMRKSMSPGEIQNYHHALRLKHGDNLDLKSLSKELIGAGYFKLKDSLDHNIMFHGISPMYDFLTLDYVHEQAESRFTEDEAQIFRNNVQEKGQKIANAVRYDRVLDTGQKQRYGRPETSVESVVENILDRTS